MNCIKVKNITKNFGNVCALNNVSLEFEKNKIYGLLGRNGAGKSTLLNIITNRIFPDSGEVTIDGENIRNNDNITGKIYFMNEKNFYPENMRVNDAFKWSREFYPDFDIKYAERLAEKFELNTKKKVKALSTGYSSIFRIITALSVNVPYILLDEPVLGLDANHRDLFYRTLIENYSENPKTFVISTHLIEEVSNVIENIVIIQKGEILKNESCEELLSKGYMVSGTAQAVDSFIMNRNVIGCDTLGGLKTAYIWGAPDNGEIPENLEIAKLDLQKLFIKLTNI